MTVRRLGFACKWIDHPYQIDGIKPKDDCKKYNTGSTTVSWLNRQSRDVAEQKLWDLMVGNIEAIRKLVERVGTLAPHLRMVRLSSDILPVYTQQDWAYFWQRPDVIAYCEKHFAQVGDIARDRNVRLSFHPGQFTVLASVNEGIVERSIEEFEYHADMARWMGYGKTFQDFKINVHISGKQGPEGIRRAYSRLSPEARSCITIENEENAWGLNDCLTITDIVPIVLDIHHHFIREGSYIQSADDAVKRVIDSWRGVRPVLHYSVSREDILVDHCPLTLPEMPMLLELGYKKQKLRAHSDFYWNQPVNEWALSFLNTHDIMCESKAKNLASFALAEQAKALTLL
jgi:UV DNA damage repair endonuclease